MEPQYKIWRDRGDNLGIQCLVCSKTFWTGFESTIDPTTNLPCSNCELIKQNDILHKENTAYTPSEDGSSPHPSSQPVQTSEAGEIIV